MSAPAKQPSSWLAVYDGTTCVGHVITRGKLGAEAFDADDHSVGIFASMAEAADALTKTEAA
jgi:hypothetical protein